jgi:hypothetical protein
MSGGRPTVYCLVINGTLFDPINFPSITAGSLIVHYNKIEIFGQHWYLPQLMSINNKLARARHAPLHLNGDSIWRRLN